MEFDKKSDKKEAEEGSESAGQMIVQPDLRLLGLYGEVEEGRALHAIGFLIDYSETKIVMPKDEDDPESELVEFIPPVEMLISTPGGSADDMFAIYDIMRKIKNDGITTLTTYGIGKVMSAGVLLLASGTKGKRMIGKNCRVMIHSVIAGTAGPMHQLENEFAEVKKIQDNYIQALVAETNMTEKEFRKLLKRKTNIYLSAEEAIELGIADEIF